MKFLVDAQLPQRLARWLQDEGHDAVHTRDLPQGNRTSDADINDRSVREQRVVVTKDEDFVDTFHLKREPCKLLRDRFGEPYWFRLHRQQDIPDT